MSTFDFFGTEILSHLALISNKLNAMQTTLERLETMSSTVSTEIATETADVAALTTAVNAAIAEINGFAAQLAAAVAAAQDAGATPDQLAAFDALHGQVEGLTAALTAATKPAA